jgi:hypothetical protein
MGTKRRRQQHHGRWVVPPVAPAAAAFLAAGLLLLVVAFHCFLSPPLGGGGGGGRRPNPPFLVRTLPTTLQQKPRLCDDAGRRFVRAPRFSLGSCPNADSPLLFSLTPFCSAEQLNKPGEPRRNLVGTVDFTVPVSG